MSTLLAEIISVAIAVLSKAVIPTTLIGAFLALRNSVHGALSRKKELAFHNEQSHVVNLLASVEQIEKNLKSHRKQT